MMKNVLRVAALAVVLALLTLMVPSFTPLAIGEETALPTYAPITLPLTDATSIDYQEKTPTHRIRMISCRIKRAMTTTACMLRWKSSACMIRTALPCGCRLPRRPSFARS